MLCVIAVCVHAALVPCTASDVECQYQLSFAPGEQHAVAFSPDGTKLVNGGGDNSVTVWRTSDAIVLRTLTHSKMVYAVRFSPDGVQLATACGDKKVRVYRATDWVLQHTFTLTDEVYDIAYSHNSQLLGAACKANYAAIFDPIGGNGGAPLVTFNEHKEDVWSIAFSPDDTLVVSGSKEKKARVWQAATGTETAVLSGHTKDVHAVAWSSDGTQIATGSEDLSARLWRASDGVELKMLDQREQVLDVEYSPSGQQVAVVGRDGEVHLYDTATYTSEGVYRGHTGYIWGVAYSKDGTRIATAGAAALVRVWSVIPPPVPPTPSPPTPSPPTPAPPTPSPPTPSPPTPAPPTPSPPTPSPPTPAPLTQAPPTPSPPTLSPPTPSPPTPSPPTQPPSTSAPLTLPPPTPAPLTAAPLTPAPDTAVPGTAVPLLAAPEPTPGPPAPGIVLERVETTTATTAASGATVVLATAVATSGAAVFTSSGMSRVARAQVYLEMLECPRLGIDRMPIVMNPTRLVIGTDDIREARGAAIGNIVVIISLILLTLCGAAAHHYVKATSSLQVSLCTMPVPLVALILEVLWTPLLQGGTETLIHYEDKSDFAIGIAVMVFCAAVVAWLLRTTWTAKRVCTTDSVAPRRRLDYICGARWVWRVRSDDDNNNSNDDDDDTPHRPTHRSAESIEYAACVFDGYRRVHCEYFIVQLIFTGTIGVLSGWNPSKLVTCSGRAGLLTCLPLIWAAILLKDKPFSRRIENWAEMALSLLEFAFAVVAFLGVSQERDDLLEVGARLGEGVGYAGVAKFCLDVFLYLRERWHARTDLGTWKVTASAFASSTRRHSLKSFGTPLIEETEMQTSAFSDTSHLWERIRILTLTLKDTQASLSLSTRRADILTAELVEARREASDAKAHAPSPRGGIVVDVLEL